MKKTIILFISAFFALSYAQSQTRVTVIGASITAGHGIAEPEANSFPGQLQSLLGTSYQVFNFGVSGTTMLKHGNYPYWTTNSYRNAIGSKPDIVIIDLGGNDAKWENAPFYNELEDDAREMIHNFKTQGGNPRVILLLPTAFFVSDSNYIYSPRCQRDIAPILRKAAYEEGAEVIDLYPLLENRPDLVPDGVHPLEKGSEIIAKRIFKHIIYARAEARSGYESFPMEKRYDSYKGLAMAGYQGWFSCPNDGSERGWYHYAGKRAMFEPGSCKVDMWPDVSEYDKIYKTNFRFADGSPAYVMSEWDESTVETHFRWMREYDIDGVFVQRFVAEIKRPKSHRQLNKVWHSAINAADANNRAIAIMYDLSGMEPGDEQLLFDDLDSIAANYDIKDRKNNTSYLHHNGKPLVAVWGIGFNDKRKYGLKEANKIIDALKVRGYSILIGVPTNWRQVGAKKLSPVDFSTAGKNVIDDTEGGKELTAVIKKCDIVMPWFVGRFNENNLSAYEEIVKGDIAWCQKNKIDYAPLAYPGFSWINMAKDSKPIPRNRGSFYQKQFDICEKLGAEMLYLAMFDEIDEGTAIFKCATRVPVGESYFLPLDEDLGNDYYLKLAGEAARKLKNR
ncbi:MAG: GDSL-type esterase/lipase family protein [Prevotellaceae bacterium]|jgi:lysophospholipase L1-like esterase|nr:GDSL-type esterase/lipase family protein [Prevotellaceae bacterium]